MSGALENPIPDEIRFLQKKKPREQKGTEEKAHREGDKVGARRCKYCGEVHNYRSCPAFGTYCNNYGIRNHFASVFQQKSQQQLWNLVNIGVIRGTLFWPFPSALSMVYSRRLWLFALVSTNQWLAYMRPCTSREARKFVFRSIPWPSAMSLKWVTLKCLKTDYKDIYLIIDCTEIFTERPHRSYSSVAPGQNIKDTTQERAWLHSHHSLPAFVSEFFFRKQVRCEDILRDSEFFFLLKRAICGWQTRVSLYNTFSYAVSCFTDFLPYNPVTTGALDEVILPIFSENHASDLCFGVSVLVELKDVSSLSDDGSVGQGSSRINFGN